MKFALRNKLCRAASILEAVVGSCVLVACVVCGVGILVSTDLRALFDSTTYFQALLNDACYIIIGIEFIKMLANHTLDSVIDVMLLAVARQMIVEHTTPLENLITVAAVAVLFVVRKYLYISQIDKCGRDNAPSVFSKKARPAPVEAETYPPNPPA
ncbi:MAG: phosphate-starvation-inducible PsiE family protein [Intestinibacillus sp.]